MCGVAGYVYFFSGFYYNEILAFLFDHSWHSPGKKLQYSVLASKQKDVGIGANCED